MTFDVKLWLKFALINLCLLAFLGVLMRYKIGFEFPYLDQKYLQHSHSHFAFSGWITHTLMVLMVSFLQNKIAGFTGNKYNKIIIMNLLCSYGMLISFIIQGYGLFSIFFSTASIVVSYFFGYQFFKDLKQIKNQMLAIKWFKAAIVFAILSSVGTFYLAYMMASKNIVPNWFLSSIYFYLHFQYNGWFFFAAMGLLYALFNLQKKEHPFYETSFKLFVSACIPAYLLSTLWLKLPDWLYWIAVASALIQVFTWLKFLFIIQKKRIKFLTKQLPFLKNILLFVGFALTLKFLLQLGSTIPSLSKFIFGYRPIIIAYLHLILLAVFSLFLLFYIYSNHLAVSGRKIKYGLLLFCLGVILNEVVLGLQGLTIFSSIIFPNADKSLFGIALLLFFSISYTTFHTIKKG